MSDMNIETIDFSEACYGCGIKETELSSLSPYELKVGNNLESVNICVSCRKVWSDDQKIETLICHRCGWLNATYIERCNDCSKSSEYMSHANLYPAEFYYLVRKQLAERKRDIQKRNREREARAKPTKGKRWCSVCFGKTKTTEDQLAIREGGELRTIIKNHWMNQGTYDNHLKSKKHKNKLRILKVAKDLRRGQLTPEESKKKYTHVIAARKRKRGKHYCNDCYRYVNSNNKERHYKSKQHKDAINKAILKKLKQMIKMPKVVLSEQQESFFNRRVRCVHCNRKFKNEVGLNRHKKIKHPTNLTIQKLVKKIRLKIRLLNYCYDKHRLWSLRYQSMTSMFSYSKKCELVTLKILFWQMMIVLLADNEIGDKNGRK